MTNERLEEIKKNYRSEIERRENYIAGLKVIGKNYKYKKDGGEFADLRKTLDGVDGIAKVEKVTDKYWYRNAGGDFRYWSIKTTAGSGIDIRIKYPSIAEFEAEIKKTIAANEEIIATHKAALEALDKVIARCDEMIHQIAAIVPESKNGEGINSLDYEIAGIMEGYIKHEIEDMLDEKVMSFHRTYEKTA